MTDEEAQESLLLVIFRVGHAELAQVTLNHFSSWGTELA